MKIIEQTDQKLIVGKSNNWLYVVIGGLVVALALGELALGIIIHVIAGPAVIAALLAIVGAALLTIDTSQQLILDRHNNTVAQAKYKFRFLRPKMQKIDLANVQGVEYRFSLPASFSRSASVRGASLVSDPAPPRVWVILNGPQSMELTDFASTKISDFKKMGMEAFRDPKNTPEFQIAQTVAQYIGKPLKAEQITQGFSGKYQSEDI